jgi:hypothetical protein
MSILQHISTGVSRSGLRVIIAGQEKMGKTTMASFAPAALLVPLEVGFAGVAVAKTPMLQSLDEVRQLLSEVTTLAQQGKFPFRTIVFDSATALERHIHNFVLQLDPAYKVGNSKTVTMESAHGGYGKAYNMANLIFEDLLKQFDMLAVHGGINIVLTCHVFSSKIIDPTSGEYDSWDLLLHSPKNSKTYGKRELATQWADIIGFLYEPMYVVAAEKGNMSKGVSQNKGRVIALSRTPAYTAGNRFGIVGEVPIGAPPQNSWNYLADAIYKTAGIDVFTR